MKNQWKWLGLLLLEMPLAAGAQGADPASQAKLIQELLARVQKLESRVAELENQSKMPRPANGIVLASMESMSPAGTTVESLQSGMQASGTASGLGTDAQPSYPSLKLAGFSDFNFSATDQRDSRSGFTEGQFALHMTSALSSKVNFFGELSATARPDAGTGTPAATGFNFEVERCIIRFDQSDRFKASFGRYHTPMNWWNTSFHHGQWLQTSISRPETVQFGSRLIPVHFVGGGVGGRYGSPERTEFELQCRAGQRARVGHRLWRRRG